MLNEINAALLVIGVSLASYPARESDILPYVLNTFQASYDLSQKLLFHDLSFTASAAQTS